VIVPYTSPALRALIRRVLQPAGCWSAAAEELLLATCAQESLLGVYRTQEPQGPGRGIFQMEAEDHDDAWQNYLPAHPDLTTWLEHLSATHTTDDMVDNDPYAIAMCRVHYMRKPGALPDPASLEAIWQYYKQWYNTVDGDATQEEFYQHYRELITDAAAS
jgi:hypothetical protein